MDIKKSEKKGLPVLIGVRLHPKIDFAEMSYLILGVEGVEKVYSVTGEYDLIITVRAGATSEFHSMIKEIRNLNGILSTKSFLVMQEFEKKVAKSNEIGEKPEEI